MLHFTVFDFMRCKSFLASWGGNSRMKILNYLYLEKRKEFSIHEGESLLKHVDIFSSVVSVQFFLPLVHACLHPCRLLCLLLLPPALPVWPCLTLPFCVDVSQIFSMLHWAVKPQGLILALHSSSLFFKSHPGFLFFCWGGGVVGLLWGLCQEGWS